MSISEELALVYKTAKKVVEGWFHPESFESFQWILADQHSKGVKGDILEIGAYHGQSACVLAASLSEGETLHLNDLFDLPESKQGHALRGNSQQMVELDVPGIERVKSNIRLVVNEKAEQVQYHRFSSLELCHQLPNNAFRFIHVDGRHDWDYAYSDLMYAVQHLTAGGVIAIDDWRSSHWPEVGQATMRLLQQCRGLRVICADAKKIYLMRSYSDGYLGNLGLRMQPHLRAIGKGKGGAHRSGWPWVLNLLKPMDKENTVILDDFVERTFGKNSNPKPWKHGWVGIFHHPPDMPPWFRKEDQPGSIIKRKEFRESLPFLRGGVALSHHLGQYLLRHLRVPIVVLKHPTETPELKFTWQAFCDNQYKRAVQIGWYLRNTHAIYQVDMPNWIIKTHLKQSARWVRTAHELIKNNADTRRRAMVGKVDVLQDLPNHAYDTLLSENVVFLELIDSSANNAVIECMVRNTPMIVNRHPAVVEYLGPNYPLYYDDISQVKGLMTPENIHIAYDYLRGMDKMELTGPAFYEGMWDFVKLLGEET
jgi:predicted O-methyltransferase YrrM